MSYRSITRLIAATSALVALSACSHSHSGPKLMGDPMNPYPLASEPKVGDIVHLPTGVKVTQPQMLAIATDARVVYVGETHDNPASHRLELDTLKALEARYPGKVALGMEMFTRAQQPVLDRWSAGELDEKQFLKESKWFDNWRMDFAYYRDLLLFARERRIPVLGLNAEKDLVAAVRNKTPEELTPEEKAKMPELDMSDPYQRGMVEAIFGGHSHGKLHLDGFVRAQTLWDETMAETAARYLASPQGKERHLLVVAGGNHISHGFGIPRRVFRRVPTSYATIGGQEIVVSAEKQKEMMDVDLPEYPNVAYDFINFFAYEELPKGILLGVMYEPAKDGKGLLVNKVVPGSNAERAGMKDGDLLLSMDGEPLKESFDLAYLMKQKHAGDKSSITVQRDGKELKLDVEFLDTELKHPPTR